MAFRIFRRFLLRWHRRIGVVLAMFVVVWTVSGIALNHSGDWQLGQRFLTHRAILALYGIPQASIRSYFIGGQWLSQINEGVLYIDSDELARCESPLQGVVQVEQSYAVLCRDELLLFTLDWRLLELVDSVRGLPANPDGIAESGGRVLLHLPDASQYQIVQFDWIGLSFSAYDSPTPVVWSTPGLPPESLETALLQQHRGEGLSWERFLLDIHSGRILGNWGVWLMDTAAIFLLLIALSGVWVWLSKPGRWSRR